MVVFSEKFCRSGSWLDTTVCKWERSEINSRVFAYASPETRPAGTTKARRPSGWSQRSAKATNALPKPTVAFALIS